jgi:hypothetical protein
MLILLDIDGVIVPARSWKQPEILNDGFPSFSSVATHALNRIVSATNASVLLTTSHKSTYSLVKWRNIFKSRGVVLKTLHRLPDCDFKTNRKDEVLNWYSVHSNTDFIIIDDDKSLNDLPMFLREKLILTSGSVGLTDELADKAIGLMSEV